MTRRVMVLGDALSSASLVEALRSRFDGEVVSVGGRVGIRMGAEASEADAQRVLEDARVAILRHRATTVTLTFDYDQSAIEQIIQRVTLRHVEPVPVPTFDREKFDRPYGKRARRALRGGHHG